MTTDDLREILVEQGAAAMRPTLGPVWVRYEGGRGIMGLALDALDPIIARDFFQARANALPNIRTTKED